MREGMEAQLQSAREKGETTFLALPRDARVTWSIAMA
jgi:hypothetical protein